MAEGEITPTSSPKDSRFPETHWSMVFQAGEDGHPQALNELCRLYWRPLFSYCCGAGRGAPDAEDLTQGYFAQLLARGSLRLADPDRGRFRTFLLSSFKNYLTDMHRQHTAAKRGGEIAHLSFEMGAQDAGLMPVAPGLSPELAFDRQWAHDVVRRATEALRTEYANAGREDWFEAVAGDKAGVSYHELAAQFGTTTDALKSFALRLKRRFRALLEQEVANSVATPDEIPGEMAYLAELLKN